MSHLLLERLRRQLAADLKSDEWLVHLHRVAHVAVQRDDGASEGARQLDDGLGGLDVDEGLIQDHDVTDANLPRDDLGLDQTLAHVRQ